MIEALRRRGARWLEERTTAAEDRGEVDSYEEEMAFEEAGGVAETLEAFEQKLPPRLRREQLVDQVCNLKGAVFNLFKQLHFDRPLLNHARHHPILTDRTARAEGRV